MNSGNYIFFSKDLNYLIDFNNIDDIEFVSIFLMLLETKVFVDNYNINNNSFKEPSVNNSFRINSSFFILILFLVIVFLLFIYFIFKIKKK